MLVLEKKQFLKKNFYINSIKKDLNITDSKLRLIKTYKCKKCFIYQNNPWFTENIARKIYANIYGQHNRSWENILNFINKGIMPNHGTLYTVLKKNIKIKNYAEFNSPFMGLFINFFEDEYMKNNKFYKKFFENAINYLSSRQVAGKKKSQKQMSMKISEKNYLNLNRLKSMIYKKNKIKKYLYTDNSPIVWAQNDNFKSVNSRSLASELFDLEIIDIDSLNSKKKIDLFGIFHTLDHTFKPKKILEFALNISKYVIVYCHVDKRLEKQHLFSISKEFLNYLKSKKINVLDLTNQIEKKYYTPELYFLCSRKKINIEY